MTLDHQLYLIMKRHKLGFYSIERDVADMSRSKTIEAIVSDPSDIAAVIEFNAVEHSSRDATSDLAIEIADRTVDIGLPVSTALRDFIEAAAGLEWVRNLPVADLTFTAI